MKKLFLISLILIVSFIVYIVDSLLGVVAFNHAYLVFSIIAGLIFGGVWQACFRKSGWIFALLAFSIFGVHFFLPPPSERLLRTVMIKASTARDTKEIVEIVKQQYEGGAYVMPQISVHSEGGVDRVDVSLLSQNQNNCTAVTFLVENGRVSRSTFIRD